MTKPTAGKERERFEAWCLKNGLFTAGHKSAAWGAWQAALADQPEPQITDAMVEAALDKLRHFGNAYTAQRDLVRIALEAALSVQTPTVVERDKIAQIMCCGTECVHESDCVRDQSRREREKTDAILAMLRNQKGT